MSAELGRKLNELRSAKGYSEEYMAELLGISPETYRAYESGELEPSINCVFRMAEFFDTTVFAMFEYEE